MSTVPVTQLSTVKLQRIVDNACGRHETESDLHRRFRRD
jgi:hypothetical protein